EIRLPGSPGQLPACSDGDIIDAFAPLDLLVKVALIRIIVASLHQISYRGWLISPRRISPTRDGPSNAACPPSLSFPAALARPSNPRGAGYLTRSLGTFASSAEFVGGFRLR